MKEAQLGRLAADTPVERSRLGSWYEQSRNLQSLGWKKALYRS